jgi:hypothetical protein
MPSLEFCTLFCCQDTCDYDYISRFSTLTEEVLSSLKFPSISSIELPSFQLKNLEAQLLVLLDRTHHLTAEQLFR